MAEIEFEQKVEDGGDFRVDQVAGRHGLCHLFIFLLPSSPRRKRPASLRTPAFPPPQNRPCDQATFACSSRISSGSRST